ncbi:MAG: hypothetical protein OXG37_11400 [Actinomycetia bacterium]|nr:hypothetical protein [Actinomycetes bacterium]
MTGVETTAAEFLQQALNLHAGEVEYYGERLRALVGAGEVELGDRSLFMYWLRARRRALGRGCKLAAMTIKLGVGDQQPNSSRPGTQSGDDGSGR